MNIPRAMSVDTTDPRFRSDVLAIGAVLDIAVNGVVSQDVVTYDIDAGFLVRHARGEDGAVLIEAGDVVLQTVAGVITAELKPGAEMPEPAADDHVGDITIMVDRSTADTLIGSDAYPASFDVAGELIQLGTVVRAAAASCALLADAWNGLPQRTRDALIRAELGSLGIAWPEAPAPIVESEAPKPRKPRAKKP